MRTGAFAAEAAHSIRSLAFGRSSSSRAVTAPDAEEPAERSNGLPVAPAACASVLASPRARAAGV